MSTAASLSLLKGGKKSSVKDELAKTPEPEVEVEAEEPEAQEDEDAEVVVDVDNMTTKQIDALVEEHEIEVPATWAKMTLAKKKAWLNEQFSEAEPEGEAETEKVVDEPEAPAEEAVEAPATPAKKPAKGKASKSKEVAPAVQSGEVIQPGDDVLSDLVHEIENMKEKEARETVAALNDATEMTMFKLGGVLSVIQANQWFDPYASFREYVEKELGLHYRKATYWVSIYNNLAESKIPWSKVKGLGWTKLKEIAEIITVDNVDEWVKIAQGQTTLQLIETVKLHKQKDAPKSIEDQTSKTVTTKTFKVHEDQRKTIEAAIEKAKGDSGTTVDTVALEFICIDYLGGQTLTQKLQGLGLEAALAALDKAFPNTNISVELSDESDG